MSETTQSPGKLVDIGAERAILAAIARFGSDFLLDISDIVEVNSFTKDWNQAAYKVFCHVLKNSSNLDIPSILSVATQLGVERFFEKTPDLNALKALFDFPVLRENATNLSKKVKKLQIARDCQQKLRECWANLNSITGEESIQEILSKFEQPIIDCSSSLSSESDTNPKNIFADIDDRLEFLATHPVNNMGFSTSWKLIDGAIGGGLRPKAITIFAGRTGTAKSHIGRHVAVYNAEKGVPTLLLDTELTDDKQIARTIANITRVPIDDIETGKFGLDEQTKARVIQESKRLKSIPLQYLSVAGKPFSEILGIIRRWVIKNVKKDGSEYSPSLVVLDYLKIMGQEGANLQEYQALGQNITMFQDLCVQFNIAGFSFAQTNRQGIDTSDLSVISGSDRLAHLATNVAIIREKSSEELAEEGLQNGNMKFIICKSRDGSQLNYHDHINLLREGQFSNIKELGLGSTAISSTNFAEDDSEQSEF